MRTGFTLAALAMSLAACTEGGLDVTRAEEPNLLQLDAKAPPGAPPGTCWDKTETPAVVETVKQDVLLQPAQVSSTGTVQSPPVFKTETINRIVRERQENWFQTPCDTDLTVEFISSVQRALAARGVYGGPVTGQMDAATRSAIRAFQKAEGLDSGTLSIDAARRLGLWTVAATEGEVTEG